MGDYRDRLLKPAQVQQILQCSNRHVYDLMQWGDLPAIRVGKKHGLRVRESKVMEFIKKKEAVGFGDGE